MRMTRTWATLPWASALTACVHVALPTADEVPAQDLDAPLTEGAPTPMSLRIRQLGKTDTAVR
jgi:hypothetical protein